RARWLWAPATFTFSNLVIKMKISIFPTLFAVCHFAVAAASGQIVNTYTLGDFEGGFDGWSVSSFAPHVDSIELSTTGVTSGSGSLRINGIIPDIPPDDGAVFQW